MRSYPDRGLHGKAVQEIGLWIVRGEVAPEEIVDIDEFGTRLDVSRTVVREALRVLAGKGLVDARPKRGTFVRDRSDWNLLDPDVLRWQFEAMADPESLEKLAEVRMMIEPSAASLAARRSNSEDIEALQAALAHMDEADVDTEDIAEADLMFHRALFAATHNELVEQLATVIEIGLRARDRYVHGHRISIKSGLRAHRKVAVAVQARDSEAASSAMVALLEAAARDARRVARQQKKSATG